MTTWFREPPDLEGFSVKLPEGLVAWVRRAEDEQDYGKDDDETPDFLQTRWPDLSDRHDVTFPPIGFLALSEYIGGDMGNGDHYGLYWPIGREDEDPLIARSSHDCGTIIPIASTLSAAARLGAIEMAPEDQGMSLPSYRYPKEDPKRIWSPIGLADRLEIDPDSPYLLVANGDVHLTAGDLLRAESLYLRAVKALPEYTAAHLGLAALHRQAGAIREECYWTLEALRSPLSLRGESFWADDLLPSDRVDRRDYRARSFARLRKMTAKDVGDLANDPLFQARRKLKGEFGIVENKDYPIYDELIDRHIGIGRPIEAVKLAMLYGESMDREHVGFYHRYKLESGVDAVSMRDDLAHQYGFNQATQKARLLKTFRAANLDARVEMLVRSTRELDPE